VGSAAFHRYNTLVRSSYLDRTVMSAMSFTAGAFPNRNDISDTRWLPNALQVGGGCGNCCCWHLCWHLCWPAARRGLLATMAALHHTHLLKASANLAWTLAATRLLPPLDYEYAVDRHVAAALFMQLLQCSVS
jgi:hypothetical protein